MDQKDLDAVVVSTADLWRIAQKPFSLQFFEGAAILPALLRLTPAVFRGFVWQIATYPAIGWGASGLWFLLELLILFWFGRDVFWRLGRQRFWLLLVRAAVGAALGLLGLGALVGAVLGWLG